MLKLMESSEPLSHPERPGPAVLGGSSSPAGPVLGGHSLRRLECVPCRSATLLDFMLPTRKVNPRDAVELI